VFVVLDWNNPGPIAFLAAVAGVIAFVLADRFATAGRFYRHGVEEALAVCAAIFIVFSTQIALSQIEGWSGDDGIAVAFAVAAVVGALCYLRFGFQYAAVAAMLFAAIVPLPFALRSEIKRLFAATVCAAFFFAAHRARTRVTSEIHEDDARIVSAAALAGVYAALNLQLTPDWLWTQHVTGARWLWWATYAAIWAIPALGIWRAIRDRDRTQLRVSVVLAVATFITNKPYLGWPRQTWDPMLFGAVLIGSALLVRRWLAAGPDGQRGGFTPERLLPSEDAVVQLAGFASAAVHMRTQRPPAPVSPTFGGGQSGGGGASGSF